ncbi:GerMN domain-containing protein [Treponema sp. R80B11-R83G3]
MAKRKTTGNSKSKGSRAVVIFWLIFVIAIICIFMANAATIKKNFDIFKTRLTTPPGAEEEILPVEDEHPVTVVIDTSAPKPQSSEETKPQTTEPAKTQTTQPEKKPAAETQTKPKTPTTTQPPPVQTRDRAIYFANVGSDGQILHSKVTRKIPVSDSPMQDALNVLLAGPTAEELSKGLLNLIPKNTRMLSATVRGTTAYINFSEDFLFNTFGVEGYVAQLRQIVWTVTEFPNVKDVQILIEGRRVDYLGEGIWIGSPISRQSF